MHRHLRTGRQLPAVAASIAVALGIAGAAPAQAATVQVSGTELRITDSSNERNIITLRKLVPKDPAKDNEVILVRDVFGQDVPSDYPFPEDVRSMIPILPGPGCVPSGTTNEVQCTVPAQPGSNPGETTPGKFTKVVANLGDGRDYLSDVQGSAALPVMELDGQQSDDFLKGGAANDVLKGSDGDDELFGFGGNDTLDGGQGTDDELNGGDGEDTVTYASRTVPLTLSLDGIANDGTGCVNLPVQPIGCEKDRIRGNVENVVGGSHNDTIIGSAVKNLLIGNAGDDELFGLSGDDQLDGGEGTNRMHGAEGVDKISGGSGADTVFGGTGDDTVDAGAGNNLLHGEEGGDTLNALGGNDTIDGDKPKSGDPLGGSDKVNAGDGANIITTGLGADTVASGSGRDVIDTGEDNDTVTAGAGNNTVGTFAGNDSITAGSGDDEIDAGAGDDSTVAAGDGNNVVDLGEGNDTMTSGGGADVVQGRGGNDVATTGAGNDRLFGHEGTDVFAAEGGDDFLQGHQGGDTLNAGDGSDTVTYSEKVNPVFAQSGSGKYGEFCRSAGDSRCENDVITTAENYIGGSNDDYLLGANGGTESNRLEGRGGNDELDGTGGNDDIRGGTGDDDLVGGDGGDRLDGGDTVTGSEGFIADPLTDGYDRVSYKTYCQPPATPCTTGVTVTLDGKPGDGGPGENDNVLGNVEQVEGSNYDDRLTGSNQRNDLYGLGGDDELTGLDGPDLIRGGANRTDKGDFVDFSGKGGRLTITLNDQPGDGEEGENDDIGADVERIAGGSNDDVIIGSQTLATNNTFYGNGGDDTLDGGLGADDLNGGVGSDTARYDRAADQVVEVTLNEQADDGIAVGGVVLELDNIRTDVENLKGGAEADVFEGSPDANILDGGAGNDVLDAAAADDVVIGGAGDDLIQGGAGSDRLKPDLGQDVIEGGAGVDTVDYSDRVYEFRAADVSVSFDDVANDGEAGENDNVDSSNETATLPGGTQTQPGTGNTGTGGAGSGSTGTGDTGTGNTGTTDSGSTGAGTGNQGTTTTTTTTTGTGSTGVRGTTTQGGTPSTTTARTTTAEAKRKIRYRIGKRFTRRGRSYVKVTGRILGSCAKGEKVRIRVLAGRKTAGRRTVKVTKACTFKTTVKLSRTAKRFKGQVKLLG